MVKNRRAASSQQPQRSVALVVLNYNYGRFLAAAIDSALAQRVPYEQVLVVDDGSTDESRRVLEGYAGRAELLFKTNGGQLSAALAALAYVRCDYVHYLDADDYLVPEARALIGSHLAGDPVKLQFRVRCVSAGARLHSVIPAYPECYDNAAMRRDSQLLGMAICPPTSGNVFRCDVLRALPLQQLNMYDYIDGVPNLAMPYCGEVRTVREVVACYRLHNSNTSQHHAPTTQWLEREVARLHERWQQLHAIMPEVPVPAPGTALIELEARSMIAALQGRHEIGVALRYLGGLVRSGMPTRKKVLLGLWTLGVALAPGRLGRHMVLARRSAVHRSEFTRKLISLWLGNRQAEPSGRACTPQVGTRATPLQQPSA